MEYEIEWFDDEDICQEIVVSGEHVVSVAPVPEAKYGNQVDVTLQIDGSAVQPTVRIRLPNTVERIMLVKPSPLREDWVDLAVIYQKPS